MKRWKWRQIISIKHNSMWRHSSLNGPRLDQTVSQNYYADFQGPAGFLFLRCDPEDLLCGARTILVVPSFVALVSGSLFYVACCSLSKSCLMFPPILVVVLGVTTVNPAGLATPPRETSTFQDLPKHLAQRSCCRRGTSNVKRCSWWKPWNCTAKSPGKVDLNLQPSNIQTELLCNEIFFNKLFSVYCGNMYINDNFYKGRK